MPLYNRERDFTEATISTLRENLKGETEPYTEFRQWMNEHADAFKDTSFSNDLLSVDNYMTELREFNETALHELNRMERAVHEADEHFAGQCKETAEELRGFSIDIDKLTGLLDKDNLQMLSSLVDTPPHLPFPIIDMDASRRKRAEENRKHNANQDQPGPGEYINGQGGYGNYKYGGSTSDKNGCGWIALYNALVAMGLYVSPADIIYWLEINGGLTVDGFLGTNISAIKAFLETQGLGVTRHWLKPKSLDEVIKSCGTFILEYFWIDEGSGQMGGHYVNITYDATNDEFLIYNLDNSKKNPYPVKSIDIWAKNEKNIYIAGVAVS